MNQMKKNLFVMVVSLALAGLSTGCFTAADGHKQAGVPFAKDTIESRYPRTVDQLLDASREVLKFNGTLVADNIVTKTLEARIDTRSVWVRVDEVEPNITRVIVQARKKSKAADIDLASEIDKQIALRLR